MTLVIVMRVTVGRRDRAKADRSAQGASGTFGTSGAACALARILAAM
jgi:hypothetical protein